MFQTGSKEEWRERRSWLSSKKDHFYDWQKEEAGRKAVGVGAYRNKMDVFQGAWSEIDEHVPEYKNTCSSVSKCRSVKG